MTFSYNVILVVDVIGTNIMGVDIIGMDSIRVDIILISTDYTLPIGYVKLCCSHFYALVKNLGKGIGDIK